MLADLSTLVFFFNDTATTEIYTLSLHDALPIWTGYAPRLADRLPGLDGCAFDPTRLPHGYRGARRRRRDRKSTRLNSSHANISYAVFCLKKKKNAQIWSRVLNYTPLIRLHSLIQ